MKLPPDTKIEDWLGVCFFAVIITLGIAAIAAIAMGY